MIQLSKETIEAMRQWIADCVWPDLEPDEVAILTDAEVVAGVRRHFDGGICGFLQTI